MQIKSSQLLETKRRYLNALIAFEATLILLLTGLAVYLRDAVYLFSFKSGLKEYLLLAAFPVIWLVCLSLFGSWDMRILDNHIDGYRLLMGASSMTFLAFCSASYLFKIQISRFVILFSLVGGTLLHLLLRWFFLRLTDMRLSESIPEQNWLIISKSSEIREAAVEFADQHQATVLVFSSDFVDFTSWVEGIISYIERNEFSRVVLADSSTLNSLQVQQLMWSVQQTNADFVAYDNLGLATSQSHLQHFDGLNWVGIGEPRISESLRVLKRLFDLTLVIPVLILLIPLFFAISILIKLDSPGEILYTQLRIGQNGKLIKFPKFRSMKKNSDQIRLAVVGRPDENIVTRYKSDPRITRVGKILRRFSLDELPQLWCVLIGTMSLVGPRPILPEEEPQLGDFDFRRQIAKPGLTGIWQVSGRKETTWDERMAFDIKYVEEWSIALDLILLAKTVKAILVGTGSY